MENHVGRAGAQRKRAFTLIELLVVIAILGILASLTMAAVSRAKNSASKAADLNNLKQIMVALHTYSADSRDVLPPPNWDGGGYDGAPAGWLYAPNLSATGTNRFNVKTGLLWETLRHPALYFCPMDKPGIGLFNERPQQISSYAMNGAVIGYNAMIYPPIKLAALRPGDCAFWETDETQPDYFNDGANYPGEGVSGRHYQGGIQAAFDTSVNYVRLKDWYDDVADKNKNRLWCYPFSADGGDPNSPGHN